MELGLAHHDPNDPNFKSHVFLWEDKAYCIGCTTNKMFMHLLLPALAVGFLSLDVPAFRVFWALLGLSATVTSYELVKGRQLNVYWHMAPNAFTMFSLYFVATSHIEWGLFQRLSLATVLALPQFGIYTIKILSEREFTNKLVKFTSRLMFVSGFFFALAGFVDAPMASAAFIAVIAYLFFRIREFSSHVAGGNKHAYLPNWTTPLVARYTSLSTPVLLLLFLLGMVKFASPQACFVSASAVPFISLSNLNYCPSCGDPVEPHEKFCDKCGTSLTQGVPEGTKAMDTPGSYPPVQQPPAQMPPTQQPPGQYPPGQYPPTQQPPGQYPPGQYPSGGYPPQSGAYPGYPGAYPSTLSRQRSEEDKTKAAVGVGIGIAVIVFLLTTNVVSAILAGIIGGIGTYLFLSTDSCCVQYCILDACSDCICSIISDD